ncbi:glycine dehydrogenase [Candidatus Endolissoclinum faulkneri L5]|uniref:Glycine dehydrogenase (decarboxylating) n=1 Tax=Candidatus Endolissoclinum faulkneri L5 TaxID=1401328 RepID=V9TQV7_9PROT|nr:aminomethyl-transferring glycine dehydrogenase [Candidatus Endolissoclinum faulkneri]AHC73259.1 glycine dehydrogenase [Candidatus Endolissoclinum faulkneri L5]
MNHYREKIDHLYEHNAFIRRHIGLSKKEISTMLALLGYDSLDSLTAAALPQSIHLTKSLDLDSPKGEYETINELAEIASLNKISTSLIGMGYYNTIMPEVIKRNVLENPSWYTAYTPYQAEISQGRLEALLNFQTMITDLTGMDIANASLLDEGTAAAEAMVLARKITINHHSKVFFVSSGVHPQTIAVLRNRAEPIGINIEVGNEFAELPSKAFGYLLQYPTTRGVIEDYREFVQQVHAQKAIVVVAADLLALTLITPPGEWHADITIGTTQRFGIPMCFGGPHAAYFATRNIHKRKMPGRLVGVSLDATSHPAYRLTLQTREQHIRREKATSNICTSQVLLAIISSMYAVYHGAEGLTRIAKRVNRLAAILVAGLEQLDCKLDSNNLFDTVAVNTTEHQATTIWKKAKSEALNLRLLKNAIGISLDETSNQNTVEHIWSCFYQNYKTKFTFDELDATSKDTLPVELRRESDFLTHSVFKKYRSETKMLRYLRQLSDKDIALDRSMIPLGSCTMKLNASTEMTAITWPEFANIHPFAPSDQTQGYLRLIGELEQMLANATGYSSVSVQPNSGAQGEYAGMLVIRAYHRSRGEAHRNICLIPSSAHGTNPASAAMAGMSIVVVACDDKGNVDLNDLTNKAEANASNLAALMITYPSTHGVFEIKIKEICQIIHENGGQVYTDGANLNALLGLCKPHEFGSDISHMNLHKTFCIPHGGGGPGVGPIGVAQHLIKFLPTTKEYNHNDESIGAVSSAPYGSAGILPISWAYIRMMGAYGLKKATQVAILNANYIKKVLSNYYRILYSGPNGLVAHECIIDLRPFKNTCGVSVDDVAKRLMDYGFHAPTIEFPVEGTLMIEPTESESQEEIDRFCDAMIAIRKEIQAIEAGVMDIESSALRHAPHTSYSLMNNIWNRPYSRHEAAFPLKGMEVSKYWPPVSRIDNVYGDRNVSCCCPPIESYQNKDIE